MERKLMLPPIPKGPKTFEEALDEVMAELRELMINKQRDYGHRNIMDFGEYGVLVRANDKIARLKNLLGKKEPKNEALEDSWRDLANYAIIALMLRKGTFTLPLKEDLHNHEAYISDYPRIKADGHVQSFYLNTLMKAEECKTLKNG